MLILLADDEPRLRQLFARYLRRAGYEVAEVADGAEAWERLKESSVDLVITDLGMPTLDGVQLMELIRAKWPSLPVVLVSGYLPPKAEEITSQGSARFLQKPVTPDELVRTVQDMLDTRHQATREHAKSAQRS
jgi:CheY-like chemotaxis protein